MRKVNSQDDIDIIVSTPDWDDAFIRESYILSPTNVADQGIVAYEVPPTIKMLICTPNSRCPGIELIFVDVEHIYLSFRSDLETNGKYKNGYIDFSFTKSNPTEIRCREMYYNFLDQSCWGKKM
jgi:hypothetical protein